MEFRQPNLILNFILVFVWRELYGETNFPEWSLFVIILAAKNDHNLQQEKNYPFDISDASLCHVVLVK